jgi:3-hydroxyisobutyrate dehydrogenase-like beta-hydroxyacid dehydrogenase
MGANLARNLASRGYRVAGFDRDPQVARQLAADHPEAKRRWCARSSDRAAFS